MNNDEMQEELSRRTELLNKKMTECAHLYNENAELKKEIETMKNKVDAVCLDRIETFLNERHCGIKEVRILFRK